MLTKLNCIQGFKDSNNGVDKKYRRKGECNKSVPSFSRFLIVNDACAG
jgi:hypothetical protein